MLEQKGHSYVSTIVGWAYSPTIAGAAGRKMVGEYAHPTSSRLTITARIRGLAVARTRRESIQS